MENKKLGKRVIRGLADTYRVDEVMDAIDNTVYLEVYQLTSIGIDELYDEDYLFDIDGTLELTDEEILDEIDYCLEMRDRDKMD